TRLKACFPAGLFVLLWQILRSFDDLQLLMFSKILNRNIDKEQQTTKGVKRMNQEELKQNALKILEESHVGILSTVKGDKPHSRYMTFFNDEFTLYTATNKQTQKVDELEANPHAHILLGYDGEGVGDTFLEIDRKSTRLNSSHVKISYAVFCLKKKKNKS